MGFRLSSAVAGFATRTSENLKSLQDKADEITKTAANRYADEALQIRKERMKSIREYTRAARELRGMGLTNPQIEIALSAGPSGVDNVKNSIINLEKSEMLKDPSFKGFDVEGRKGAINSLFTNLPEDATGRDIKDQAKIYATGESPFVAPDMSALSQSVSQATKTLFSPEGVGSDYVEGQFKSQVEAAGGAMPENIEGTLGFTGASMRTVTDPVALLNALQVQKNLEKANVEIDALKLDNKFKQFSNPLILKDLRQKIKNGEISAENEEVKILLNKAKLSSERIDLENKRKFGTKQYELELEKIQKEINNINKPSSYEDFIVGMQWELSQIDAEKEPAKVALLKSKINEANMNYTAFEMVGEGGDVDLTALGSMQKLLGQIVTNKSAGKFVMGTDFLIGESGDIIWKGDKEGQNIFNDMKSEAKLDFVNALAPNGKFVNEGARIAVTGLAGDTYRLMYPTPTELTSMVQQEYLDPESNLNTGKTTIGEVVEFVLQKLKVRDPKATLDDAKAILNSATKS